MLNSPTSKQYETIAIAIINKLTNRSGFDEAFNLDPEIMEEIWQEIGHTAFEESIKCLTLNSY